MPEIVCSTTHLFHYMFNEQEDTIASMLEKGIRPLSDFPDSERWQQLEAQMPGFYKNLYEMLGKPILKKPYVNSGVFITPIDFYKLPGTYLYDKARIAIPIEYIETESAVATYVINEERKVFAFASEILEDIAQLWPDDMIRKWFNVDPTKAFFYVPQVATYQIGGIKVTEADFQRPTD